MKSKRTKKRDNSKNPQLKSAKPLKRKYNKPNHKDRNRKVYKNNYKISATHTYNTRSSAKLLEREMKSKLKASSKPQIDLVQKKKVAKNDTNLIRYDVKNKYLSNANRDLRRKNREYSQNAIIEQQLIRKLKKELVHVRNKYSLEMISSADLLHQLREQDDQISYLMSRISVLELAEKEKYRSRNAQQKIIDLKDEIIENLLRTKQLGLAHHGGDKKDVTLTDLPEEVIRCILDNIPNAEIVWSFGLTCQQFMEIALRYVWVIEDSIQKPMSGYLRDDMIDLTITEPSSASSNSNRFLCRISNLISSEIVGRTIYHFVFTENFGHHQNVLDSIKELNQNYHPKKVLLLRNRNLNLSDILVRFTSQWSQLESIVINSNNCHISTEKLKYILDNSPNLRYIDFSCTIGGFLSSDQWSMIASKCTNLTHLVLYGCCITDKQVELLTSNNKKLSLIDIQRCKIMTLEGLQSILRNCEVLQTLTFSMVDINFETKKELNVDPKCTNLKKLSLDGINISVCSIKRIAEKCSKLSCIEIFPKDIICQQLLNTILATNSKQLT